MAASRRRPAASGQALAGSRSVGNTKRLIVGGRPGQHAPCYGGGCSRKYTLITHARHPLGAAGYRTTRPSHHTGGPPDKCHVSAAGFRAPPNYPPPTRRCPVHDVTSRCALARRGETEGGGGMCVFCARWCPHEMCFAHAWSPRQAFETWRGEEGVALCERHTFAASFLNAGTCERKGSASSERPAGRGRPEAGSGSFRCHL